MEFQPVKAKDKEIIDKYMKEADSRSCDMSFAAVYLWKDFYLLEYAVCGGMIIFRTTESGTSYSFPIGAGDPEEAVMELKKYCLEHEEELKFHCVYRKNEAWLLEHHPGEFEITFDRDIADYVYDCEKLINLRGKKFHGKKNHINKFMKTYDWQYETITRENTGECLSMLYEWKNQNCEPGNIEKHAEICVSENALRNREFLGLKGGLLRADGKVVAFALGEQISSDTLAVHIEKAFSEIPGAYAMINQQFLLHASEGLKYVNREDDVGEPGLRKAKLSYHPEFLVEKGFARLKRES